MEPPDSRCELPLSGWRLARTTRPVPAHPTFFLAGNFCLEDPTNSLLAFAASAESSATRRVLESS